MKNKKKSGLKLLKGNFRAKKRSNIPRMPRGLSAESKKVWRKLLSKIDHSILLPCDGFALMLVADALADRERFRQDFTFGRETREFAEVMKLQNDMVYSGLKQFFLTPTSRVDLVK